MQKLPLFLKEIVDKSKNNAQNLGIYLLFFGLRRNTNSFCKNTINKNTLEKMFIYFACSTKYTNTIK